MAGTYELWLTTDAGFRIKNLDGFLSLTATRVANEIAGFKLNMPPTFDESLLAPDRMVQVWRAPAGGKLGFWRAYFVREWEFATMDDGAETLEITGPDQNDLLRRRIVAAYSGTPYASKVDFADDMMKEAVSESQVVNGNLPVDSGSRAWNDFSVQADTSSGPAITKSFPFHYLLTESGEGVLAIIANAAKAQGEEVFFDVALNAVTGSSISFQFRTYTGQPGMDVTRQVVFNKDQGNMKSPKLRISYAQERNYIYAAGQGEGEGRKIKQVYDVSRYNLSQWNRCEGFADARNESTETGVEMAGYAALAEGQPKIRFSAVPVDTEGTRFGRDWDFGYKVTAKYRNYENTHIIRAVSLTVDGNGKESIQTRLDYES